MKRSWLFSSFLFGLVIALVFALNSCQSIGNFNQPANLTNLDNSSELQVDKFAQLPETERFVPKQVEHEQKSQNSVTIAVISDLNSQYGSTDYEPEVDKAIDLIIHKWHPDLVLGGGDAIAGQKKSLTRPQIEAMWAAFDSHVAKPLRDIQIPYAFTIGNHDGSGAIKANQFTFAKERDLAAAYWQDPDHDSGIEFVDRANFPFYFSFEQNNIYYLVWDASTHIIDSQQLAWVEKSLASSKAQSANLRIAIGHLPLYAVAEQKNKPGEYLAAAESLRGILEKYRVHTYISGHHHAYYPGKKGNLELLFAGALGQGARKLIGSDRLSKQTLTLILVNQDEKSTSYKTYDLKTLQVIETAILPEFIISNNGLISRQDKSEHDFLTELYQLCKGNKQLKICQIESHFGNIKVTNK